MQDKYKHRYVKKVIELKKKLSEVEEKDEKLLKELDRAEKYNETNLVGVVIIYRVCNL